VYEGGNVGEEFVETEYYKDLGGVGKQHHTVATAFFSTSCCFQFHTSMHGSDHELLRTAIY